jgi:hypothetical protein
MKKHFKSPNSVVNVGCLDSAVAADAITENEPSFETI